MTALNVTYRITRRLPIGEASTLLHINTGAINSGTLADLVKERKGYPDITATLAPTYSNPAPDLDPVTGAPLNGNQSEVNSPVTFYLFDHLGNTRVTFRADASDAISITYAADYYPYGKILREYNCTQNRYLSTHHERDAATGYDNRGARLYDSEIGRFLGVDPLAQDFAAWSGYNYVLGNPVRLVDPDGRSPDDIIIPNKADRAAVLKMINARAEGTFKADDNGRLYLADANSGDVQSTYYRDKLVSAIESDNVISIEIGETATNAANQEFSVSEMGEGLTLYNNNIADVDSGEASDLVETATVTVTGRGREGVTDADGNSIRHEGADILVHEIVGHAVPLVVGPDTGNAIENENKVRCQQRCLDTRSRKVDPTHTEQ